MEEKEKKGLLWILSLPVAAVVLFLLALVYGVYFVASPFKEPKTVKIESGMGSRKVAELLKKEGFIRSKWAFVTYVTLAGEASRLKPGEYEFSDRDSIVDITNALVKGGKNEIIITIPEGLTNLEVAELLENKKLGSVRTFLDLVSATGSRKFRNNFAFLKDLPETSGLEGYLFPDTYHFFKNSSGDEIVTKFLQNFDRKLSSELREEIAKQEKTIFETVTMASLIEIEVVSDEDRTQVAGILWKRLDKKIPLQVDATLAYIKKQNLSYAANFKPQNGRRFSKEDTQIDSPYNTYKYTGLPPGPISNPGLSAIKAAVYPKSSLYFYYLSTPDGETIFSKTLEEHNKAKTRYFK